MKTTIILLSLIICAAFVNAQNDTVKQFNTLYVIKLSDGKNIKTNHFLVETKDIQNIELPSKASAIEKFGPITEDIVMLVTLKKNVTLFTMPTLLEKYGINQNDANLPFFIDSVAIKNPNDIVSTGDVIRKIVKMNKQINIITKSPLKNVGRKDLKGIRH